MKVSLSWLKDYVAIEEDVTKLADALTMAGLEVDALVDRYAYLGSVVAGRIIEIGPHPNADTLSVVKVDVGSGTKTIVCGATNVQEGDLVPVALVGAELPSGDTVEAGHIRGQDSDGMLCSEAELAVGTDISGILLLPESTTPGAGVVDVLGLSDTIIEFDLTPNRSDCLSIIGIAREVAAILKVPLKHPEVTLPAGDVAIEELASVTIEAPDHCPRYAARVVQDVQIGPSPFWIQDRLHSIGLRAINNVVDVTNFVMMEMGQPLHAFDFNRLAEHRIVVRTAQAGQAFSTLDGMERTLAADMLMICDGKGPVALAGIMGGLESEIEDDTVNVLIESAYFDPISVRRTAKRLGLTTESSYRFERGVDPEGVPKALDRAAQLMVQTAGGKLAAGVIDNYPRPIAQRAIELSVKRTNRLLGTEIDREEISGYLTSVELDVEPVEEDRLRVAPPTFRVDLKRPEDLMEEVARLKGYDQIPTTHPLTQVVACAEDKNLRVRRGLRQTLSGCGFSEIATYSFIDEGACDRLLFDADDPRRQMLPILNPLTEDQTVMRTSLLPGLLATMHLNSTQRNEDLRIFEVGKIFLSPSNADRDQLPKEVQMVSGLWTGARCERTWHAKGEEVDFYDIKGVVESLCVAMNINGLRFAPSDNGDSPHLRLGRAAKVYAGSELLGVIGELKRQVLDHFDLKQRAYCFDLNLDKLVHYATEEKRAMPLSRFPSTTRDLALMVDDVVEAQSVLDFVDALGEDLIGGGEVFDVYKGARIPQGKKSVAFRFTYRSFERSLTDTEVNSIHEDIARKVLKEFRAELPSS
ncbi:MAG: phenylalanine--tRNA ligase subunit beta [Thermodesulfobacteriota bacterium]|nr:phenylalanine--tRNA ligase subunit beta [Thermodesulfobacteriota bacterium]